MEEGPQFAKPKACKVNIGFPYGIGVPPFYKTKKFVIRELRPCAPRLAGWVACFPQCKFLSVNLSHTHTHHSTSHPSFLGSCRTPRVQVQSQACPVQCEVPGG